MKKRLYLIAICFPCLLLAQNKQYASTAPTYIRNIDAADEFFEAGSYREAICFYERALEVTDVAFRPKYRLVLSFLRTREFASANHWLQKIANQHPDELCWQVLDESTELYRYRPFLDWLPLQKASVAQQPQYDYLIKAELAEIHHFDQFIRSEHRLPNAGDCKGSKYYWPGMSFRQVDSVNEVRLTAIINRVGGYPGSEIVGTSETNTAWLVIQHAPLDFQEKYYLLVEQAAKEGKTSMGNWAYLVDRMNMNRDNKQIYGSQMRLKEDKMGYEIYPLEDPINVNKRRAEVGLGPIETYIEQWGIKFEPEKMQ
jgi:tetratricopeptide (TPR) repeat protein